MFTNNINWQAQNGFGKRTKKYIKGNLSFSMYEKKTGNRMNSRMEKC